MAGNREIVQNQLDVIKETELFSWGIFLYSKT